MISACIVAGCLLGSCAKEQGATPRREGYARIEPYAAEYATVIGAPVAFEANLHAVSSIEQKDDSSTWLTIAYPAYNAKIYVTFTPVVPTTADDVVDNRLERISLNFGNAPVDVTEFVNRNGYACTLASSPSATSLPVHFLAIPPGKNGMLVSGSLFIDIPDATAEQSAPIVKYASADIMHALENL